ncbi:hypothetical protein MACJ_002088 [Theileria orientalis]|uniref:Uncharacterized protein n=1 Tax=Theileria orientalis TaxID=68886 RepID=A0A976M5J1_THEOR|nr:hypothetical protein MACJ_002088 [Theileria orientalis]
MGGESSLTVEIGSGKYDLDYYLDLFKDENFKQLVIVTSLKDSTKGISLCERIKRNVRVTSEMEMRNFLEEGTERRTLCKLVITLNRT